MLERRLFHIDNGAGWRLGLQRFHDPDRLRRAGNPVAIVPGFAMNSFIFGYHPRGQSLVGYLAARGHEVWCLDLRAQGLSERYGPRRSFGMRDLGLVDLAAALDGVQRHTLLDAQQVDALGCSLGGTFVFMHAAWHPGSRIARLVNMGGPLRWEEAHPLVRAFAQLPVGLMPIIGTRTLARRALPLAAKIPGLLHLYLHPAICDLSEAEVLCNTVEDPKPRVNLEIARWIRRRDLIIDGRNLTEDLARVQVPLLTVVANADGIVPERTVCSGDAHIGSSQKQVVIAGTADKPMAHADLFISDPAEAQVFRPIADWLDEG